jgi:hypothetical protein
MGVEEGGGRLEGRYGHGWMSPYITPLQRHSITMREDHQEVARSALVKEIESKRAMLMWRTALGCLWWNCAIFNFACSYICSSH